MLEVSARSLSLWECDRLFLTAPYHARITNTLAMTRSNANELMSKTAKGNEPSFVAILRLLDGTKSQVPERRAVRFQSNFPNSRNSPSKIVSGCGGQPGMNKSTGTMEPAPFKICGWLMNGPPAIAQAPTAMTSFGGGKAA